MGAIFMVELKQRYAQLLEVHGARTIMLLALGLYGTNTNDNVLSNVELYTESGEVSLFDTTGLTRDELLEPCVELLLSSQDLITSRVNWEYIIRLLIHPHLGEWGLKRVNSIGWKMKDRIDFNPIKQALITFFQNAEKYGGWALDLKRDNFGRLFEFLKVDSETSQDPLKSLSLGKNYTQVIEFIKNLDLEKQQLFFNSHKLE